MTLTYKFDLDILPLDLHTKTQVCMSVHSAVTVVTLRQTDDATTITLVTDVGCNDHLLSSTLNISMTQDHLPVAVLFIPPQIQDGSPRVYSITRPEKWSGSYKEQVRLEQTLRVIHLFRRARFTTAAN